MLIKVKHKRVVKHLISFQLDKIQIADVAQVAECPRGWGVGYKGEGKCHREMLHLLLLCVAKFSTVGKIYGEFTATVCEFSTYQSVNSFGDMLACNGL